MGLFSLFRGATLENNSLANIKADIHSHLLPGIDDGAPTMDHTIGMLRKMQALGFKKLILTPHVMSGVYDNTTAIITEKLETVRQVAKQAEIELDLEASAEYFFDETLFKRIAERDLLPFHTNHILFEFSFHTQPDRYEELIFQFKTAGYQPVLAHYERYHYFHNNRKKVDEIKQLGCLIQVNWNSFTGHYGPDVRKQAMRLLESGAIDVLGTDCHRIQHLELLEKFLKTPTAQKLLSKTYLNQRV
jgi:tyrosine-protein phosphatase YwqE